MDIDKQTKPEGLKKVKDETLFAIKEAEAQEIAVEEVQERSNIEW